MRRLALQLAALVMAVHSSVPAAARGGVAPAAAATPYELVVFEADGCYYCEDFRRDVLPLYRASQIGRETPLRFVNVSRADETKMGLSGAIVMAPTVVLMHQGQEVDRIVGYTGPGNFMKLVAFMMGRGD